MKLNKEFVETVLKNVKAEREKLQKFPSGDSLEIADKHIEILEDFLNDNEEEYDDKKTHLIFELCEWLNSHYRFRG